MATLWLRDSLSSNLQPPLWKHSACCVPSTIYCVSTLTRLSLLLLTGHHSIPSLQEIALLVIAINLHLYYLFGPMLPIFWRGSLTCRTPNASNLSRPMSTQTLALKSLNPSSYLLLLTASPPLHQMPLVM